MHLYHMYMYMQICRVQELLLTVLKMGGVSMGSFWSKMMDALASMVGRGPSCCFALTVKVTKPCPVVPLFGGRKPTLGSAGASPISSSAYDVNYR